MLASRTLLSAKHESSTLHKKPAESSIGALFSLSLCLSLAFSLACPRSDDETSLATTAAAPGKALAIVDETPISADAVDRPLQLDLHDLEHAKYQRRLDQLQLLIAQRLGPTSRPIPPNGSPGRGHLAPAGA
jgi:hypothetical protein